MVRDGDEAAPEGGGRISTRVRERHYRIVGSDARMLRRSIELLGPALLGHACTAYTHWQVRWSYAARQRDGVWLPEDVQVACEAEVRLPRWDPPRNSIAELITLWRDVEAELRAHEQGHVDIGFAAARDVHIAVVTTSPCSSKQALAELVRQRTDRAVECQRRREIRYDAAAHIELGGDSALARFGRLG